MHIFPSYCTPKSRSAETNFCSNNYLFIQKKFLSIYSVLGTVTNTDYKNRDINSSTEQPTGDDV